MVEATVRPNAIEVPLASVRTPRLFGIASAAGDAVYLRQLDGLRAVAVFGVLVSHLTAFGDRGGSYGVALFFVLSGYLITGILLRCKGMVEAGQLVPVTLYRFYMRRFLRILPIVYLVLMIGWLLGDLEIRRLIWWHLGYISNFLFAAQGFPEKTAHFWSLAVEEQFYFIWPLFIILCPRRAIMPVTVSLIGVSAIFRIVAADGLGLEYPEVLTPWVIDELCFGALLSLAEGDGRAAAAIAWGGPPAALVAMLWFFNLLPFAEDKVAAMSVVFCCRGLAFAWFVGLAARGDIRVLGASFLVFIGRISYGIYVYHPFVDTIYEKIGENYHDILSCWPVRLTIVTVVSVVLATISCYFLESPINSLKRYFPYSVSPKPNIFLVPASRSNSR